jgi:hypothetical protein
MRTTDRASTGRATTMGGELEKPGLPVRKNDVACSPSRTAGIRGSCRRSNPALRRWRPLPPCGETPGGRSSRARSKARWRACGSARSCIQLCPSHSLIAPASCSTAIAQPRKVRVAGRFSLVVISILSSCLDESFRPASGSGRLAQSRDSLSQGFGLSTCSAGLCKTPSGGRRASSFHRVRRWSATSAPCLKAKLRIPQQGSSRVPRRRPA